MTAAAKAGETASRTASKMAVTWFRYDGGCDDGGRDGIKDGFDDLA
jgi:hypothetical protein